MLYLLHFARGGNPPSNHRFNDEMLAMKWIEQRIMPLVHAGSPEQHPIIPIVYAYLIRRARTSRCCPCPDAVGAVGAVGAVAHFRPKHGSWEGFVEQIMIQYEFRSMDYLGQAAIFRLLLEMVETRDRLGELIIQYFRRHVG